MSKPVYRCHYRGRLEAADAAQLSDLLQQCEQNAQQLINDGALMTAALYYYGNQLFLYYEAVGEEIRPECFMAPLHPVLSQWPQKEDTCDWALMYNVFWHDAPKDDDDWKRSVPPERRRGRIAWLKHDTMFRYVYHHFAIAEEGILQGDRYQSIALHEDILFSYFEEPRTPGNLRRDTTLQPQTIQAWLDVNPESHFIPLPGSNGSNFLLLPQYFALGE